MIVLIDDEDGSVVGNEVSMDLLMYLGSVMNNQSSVTSVMKSKLTVASLEVMSCRLKNIRQPFTRLLTAHQKCWAEQPTVLR